MAAKKRTLIDDPFSSSTSETNEAGLLPGDGLPIEEKEQGSTKAKKKPSKARKKRATAKPKSKTSDTSVPQQPGVSVAEVEAVLLRVWEERLLPQIDQSKAWEEAQESLTKLRMKLEALQEGVASSASEEKTQADWEALSAQLQHFEKEGLRPLQERFSTFESQIEKQFTRLQNDLLEGLEQAESGQGEHWEKLQSQLKELEATQRSLSNVAERDELESVHEKLDALDGEWKALEQKLQDVISQKQPDLESELRSLFEVWEAEFATKLEALTTSSQPTLDWDEILAPLEERFTALAKRHEEDLEVQQAETESLQAKLAGLTKIQTDLESLKEQGRDTQNQVLELASLHEEIEALQKSVSGLESRLAEQPTEVASAEKVDAMSSAHEELVAQYNTLQTQWERVQEQLAGLEARWESFDLDEEDDEDEPPAASQAALDEGLATIAARLEALEAQVTSFSESDEGDESLWEERFQQWTQESQSLWEERLLGIEERLSASTEQESGASVSLEGVEARLAAIETQLEEWPSMPETNTEALESLASRLESLQEELAQKVPERKGDAVVAGVPSGPTQRQQSYALDHHAYQQLLPFTFGVTSLTFVAVIFLLFSPTLFFKGQKWAGLLWLLPLLVNLCALFAIRLFAERRRALEARLTVHEERLGLPSILLPMKPDVFFMSQLSLFLLGFLQVLFVIRQWIG